VTAPRPIDDRQTDGTSAWPTAQNEADYALVEDLADHVVSDHWSVRGQPVIE
jgi:hypothetical protein